MREEKFDELVKNLVESSRSSAVLCKDHGVDLFEYERKYNAVIDTLGVAYFGEETWDELMEALFTDDPAKTLEQIRQEII